LGATAKVRTELTPRVVISLFVGVSLSALLLIGCRSAPGRPTLADFPTRPSNVTDFTTLYQQNCAGCHGADGRFGAAIDLNNPVYLGIIDNTSMRRVIAQGVPGTPMPPFAPEAGGNLTHKQIDLLIAGIRGNWAGASGAADGAPSYSFEPGGNLENGAQVFASNCQSCHGPDATGAIAAGSVVDPSFLSLVSNQYLRTIVIAGRPDLGHPDWKHAASGQPLTAQQVADVVAWLASKRPATLSSRN
jgi:cytochrome c oxidase cbb3-type subunit III